MTSKLLKNLLAASDLANEPRNTRGGKLFSDEYGVPEGPEYLRIRALLRRVWQDDPELDEVVTALTEWLRKPNGQGRLLPMQAKALQELHDHGKLSVVANVGKGKTLVTALAPTVMEAKRPLFVTYKKLLDKTIREFRKLAEDWRVAQNYQFVSAETFSTVKSADLLDKLEPDLIVCDEAHLFKSPKSGRTKRLDRYLKAHPECRFVPLTGTPGDDSIKNIAHIQRWVHGADNSPLPTDYLETEHWSQCLDSKVIRRRAPGALVFFSKGAEDLDDVRRGVGARISETPGNVYDRSETDAQCSLYLEPLQFDGYPESTETTFQHVRETGDQTPDGRILETPIEAYLLYQTMALEFYHIIDPPPPPEWRSARKDWTSFVRDILGQTKLGLDTPLQVGQLCHRGELDSQGAYERWKALEPTFKPNSKTVWFGQAAVEFIADWMLKNHAIVWVEYPCVGNKLKELTGLPFFHAQGVDQKAGSVEEFDGKTSAILSRQANFLGRNLQDRWNRMLFTTPPSKSDILEQALGRLHRQGQTADEVEAFFFLGSIENLESLYKARARAEFDRDYGRSESNKLLTSDWCLPTFEDASQWKGPRWKK